MTSTASLAQGEIRTHRSGDLVITLAAHGHAGYLIQTRRDGVIDRKFCSQHNHEYDAVRRFDTLVDEHEAPGEQTTVTLGSVAVQIRQQGMVWRVETTASGRMLEQWSRSYADRDEALPQWLRVASAFRTHRDAERIERRAEELRREYREQMGRERRGMHNRGRMDAIERELERLADLNHTDIAALAAA